MNDWVILIVNGLCETNSVLAQVVNGIVFSKEHVSNDPDGASWGRDVKSHESRYAVSLHFKDIVRTL